ncbi:MAG: hypothetical protein EOO00_00305 [Chitinophagaceae bacterium]|nr:MAG: hypothetical protein EOO00_00305 [Chitinophagaceae bacterium]
MNTYRYEVEKRRAWVRDKMTRAKTVRQICQEAQISRATLYNWIDEFENDDELRDVLAASRQDIPKQIQKASRPELLNKVNSETGEKYRMLVSSIAGIDNNRNFSRKLVAVLIKRFTLTVAQACAIVGMEESSYGYKPRKPEVEDYIVYEGLVNLICENRRRSFEELYELLQQKHPDWTRKQMKRVYRDGMVYLERTRTKRPKDTPALPEVAAPQHDAVARVDNVASPGVSRRLQRTGGTWSMGLIEDEIISNGVPEMVWLLFIIDEDSGLAMNGSIGAGIISTEEILSFMDRAVVENGSAKKLKVPGKPALSVRELTRWVWEHKMALHTFSLQKPENQSEISRIEAEVKERLSFYSDIGLEGIQSNLEDWLLESATAGST